MDVAVSTRRSMADTRELFLIIRTLDEELDKSEQTIINFGKQAGVSADQMAKVNTQLKESTKSATTLSKQADVAAGRVSALRAKAQQLKKALAEADGDDQKKLSAALKQVEKDLEAATADANKLASATSKVGSQAKKTSGSVGGIGKGFNLGSLTSKLGGVSNILGQLGFAAGGAGGGLLSLAAAAGPVGAAIAAVIGVVLGLAKVLSASVDIAKEYETNLASLAAITGLPAEGLAELSDRAQNFVIRINEFNEAGQPIEGQLQRITLNASQAAQAFEVVGSKVPDLLKVPAALDQVTRQAAVLSETSLGLSFEESVAGLTTSINQFLPVGQQYANEQERANAIVRQGEILTNQLAAAQQLGAVPVTGLAQSLEKFGAVSVANNVSSAESIALAETLGQKFSDQATVGTNLRNIISILAADTSELGLSFQGADGQVNGIQGSITALQAKLESFTDPAERAAFLAEKFGRENAAAAQILVNNREQVEALTVALDEQAKRSLANGAAAQQAAINADTYAKAQERLSNTLNQVGNTIGQSLLPVLTFLTNLVDEVISRFDEATEGLDPLRQAFGVLIDTVSELLEELGLAGGQIDFVGGAMTALKFILEAVTAGITIAVKAISGLVDWYRILLAIVKGAAAAVAEFSRTVVSAFKGDFNAFSGLGDRLKAAFFEEVDQIDEILAPTIREIGNKLENIVKDEFNGLQFGGDAGNLANEIQAGLNAALAGVDPEQAAQALNTLGPIIRSKIDDALDRGNISLDQADRLQAQLEGVIGRIIPDAAAEAAAGGEGALPDLTGDGSGDLTGGAADKTRQKLEDLQKQLKELKKERLKLDVDSPRLPVINEEIQDLEARIKSLKGEVKVELTADEKRLDAILTEINRTKVQLAVETDPAAINELEERLKGLGQLEQMARLRIEEGPFQDDLEKLKAEAEKFRQEVENRTVKLGVQVAITEGDFSAALQITTEGIRNEAERQKAALDEDPILVKLFETDPAAAAILKQQAIQIIEQTRDSDIQQATEALAKQTGTDYVEALVEGYTDAISASSDDFQAVAAALQAEVLAISQAIQITEGASDVQEARGLLSQLGFSPDTIPQDLATVEEAVQFLQAQLDGARGQLLQKQQEFSNSFIAQTQQTLEQIQSEISKLEAQAEAGGLDEGEQETLELLRVQYRNLTGAVSEARAEVIGLAEDINKTDLEAFEEAFRGASGTVNELGDNINSIAGELGLGIDPGQLRAGLEIYEGLKNAAGSYFDFRLQKASQVNAEELDALDQQIQEAEARQAAGAEGQGQILERLNTRRQELLEERAEEERKIQLQQFRFNKATQVAEAIINNAGAFVKTLNGPIPFPGNVIAAGLVAAAGAFQIATILAAKPSFYHGTRSVTDSPGNAGRDSVEARLHRGERVVPTKKNLMYFDDFNAVEDGGLVPGAAAVLASMPKALQQYLMKQPDSIRNIWQYALGGDDSRTAINTRVVKTNQVRVGKELIFAAGQVIQDSRPVLQPFNVSTAARSSIEGYHRDRASMFIQQPVIDQIGLAKEIADQMYRMQHKDSSVPKYQLDALRYGIHDMMQEMKEMNKQLKELNEQTKKKR